MGKDTNGIHISWENDMWSVKGLVGSRLRLKISTCRNVLTSRIQALLHQIVGAKLNHIFRNKLCHLQEQALPHHIAAISSSTPNLQQQTLLHLIAEANSATA